MQLKIGKILSRYGNVIGISDDLKIFGGYDSGIPIEGSDLFSEYSDNSKLETKEAKEVCELMIERWQRLLESL